MKLTIKSTETKLRTGSKNGREWSMRNQFSLIQIGDEIREVQLLIPEGSSPYAPGQYEVDFEKSCYVNAYGSLTMSGEIRLKAVSVMNTKAA